MPIVRAFASTESNGRALGPRRLDKSDFLAIVASFDDLETTRQKLQRTVVRAFQSQGDRAPLVAYGISSIARHLEAQHATAVLHSDVGRPHFDRNGWGAGCRRRRHRRGHDCLHRLRRQARGARGKCDRFSPEGRHRNWPVSQGVPPPTGEIDPEHECGDDRQQGKENESDHEERRRDSRREDADEQPHTLKRALPSSAKVVPQTRIPCRKNSITE